MYKVNHQLGNKINQWYWESGCNRAGNYQLTRGGWLDRVHRIFREQEVIEQARTKFKKPTMALWGPSQSGKSTLLQAFIDGDIAEGEGSPALTWSEKYPARFCGNASYINLTVLNPFNFGHDASGCVTRFQLKSKVTYPDYPVEVNFSNETELMLSLAVGYLSETSAKTSKGERLNLTADIVKSFMPQHQAEGNNCQVDQPAYQQMVNLCDVLEVLIDMDYPRYLGLEGQWSSLRREILNNSHLATDIKAVIVFISKILWDEWGNITALYQGLRQTKEKLYKIVGSSTVYCSWEVASILLDISAVVPLGTSNASALRLKDIVLSFKIIDLGNGDKAFSTVDVDNATRLFAPNTDLQKEFGLLQGLVSLLIIPIRDEAIKNNNALAHELLSEADLIDFPGVSNEHRAATLLENEKLALHYEDENGKKPCLALTQVMKRGKTASIVVSNSRNLNIDVFSLLVRMPTGTSFPAQPDQLMNGIKSWCKAMGSSFPSSDITNKLPINLVLTFSASLINTVKLNGTGKTGLHGVFGRLTQLGDLANAQHVRTFTTNYPQFEDGEIKCESDDELKNIIEQIASDSNFLKYFCESLDTLYAMSGLSYREQQFNREYGGRLYFFKEVLEQLRGSKRQQMLSEKAKLLSIELQSCLTEALPPNSEDNVRANDINALIAAISIPDPQAPQAYRYDIEELSKEILNLMNVDPSILQSIPSAPGFIGKYIESQITIWRESIINTDLQSHMGFSSIEHRTRVVSYILSDINTGYLVTWLQGVCPSAAGNVKLRQEFRRLVATYMTECFFRDCLNNRQEMHKRNSSEAIEVLSIMSACDMTDLKSSPYYHAVIVPFLNYLHHLRDNDPGNPRGMLIGDDELVAIVNSL